MRRTENLTPELLKLKEEIRAHALDYGLDFFEVMFLVCDLPTINLLAARDGFPSRYPHWRFGMQYDGLDKGHTYGFQKIYELVINSDPSYAYLLKSNSFIDQKLVMSHVYGHSDFFKNNIWFSNTDRDMVNVMANNASKIKRYMDKYGQDKVEDFIDTVLSLDNLICPREMFENLEIKRHRKDTLEDIEKQIKDDNRDDFFSPSLKSFMKKEVEELPEIPKDQLNYINSPKRDILKILAKYAPIEDWQSDVISMLRKESYYFYPQRLTKIMNEGWASYWHSRIMTEKAATSNEIIDFAEVHSSVMFMPPKGFNPYKIGIELFRDIKYRWDTGRFGREWEECDDLLEKENWNKDVGLGTKKIFDIRKTHNDVTFIEEFLTPEFCQENKLFVTKTDRRGNPYVDRNDFQAIKESLLTQLTNGGAPVIEAVNTNGSNVGELVLEHRHHGADLDLNYAKRVLENLFKVWKRPIRLVTQIEGQTVVLLHSKDGMKIIE